MWCTQFYVGWRRRLCVQFVQTFLPARSQRGVSHSQLSRLLVFRGPKRGLPGDSWRSWPRWEGSSSCATSASSTATSSGGLASNSTVSQLTSLLLRLSTTWGATHDDPVGAGGARGVARHHHRHRRHRRRPLALPQRRPPLLLCPQPQGRAGHGHLVRGWVVERPLLLTLLLPLILTLFPCCSTSYNTALFFVWLHL